MLRETSEILEILREKKEYLYKRFGVCEIGIFGSFARGENAPQSDVDVLVEFLPEAKNFDNYMDSNSISKNFCARGLISSQSLL